MIQPGDVIFDRTGRPVVITSRNGKTAEVTIDSEINKVAEHARFGIKNGLSPEQRDSYEASREQSLSANKREEIGKLRERIRSMRESGGDRLVIRYLENELQHLIVREDHVPNDYYLDEHTFVK